MNDFTKEELEDILTWAHAYGASWTTYKLDRKLINKIQDMIDNSDKKECHHQWIKCLYGEDELRINLCVLCNARENP